jgi:hypothetical protein
MKHKKIYSWTISFLALFAGGSITVLFILVPIWQSLAPEEVLAWFANFGARVGITMVPMQVIPLVLSIYAWYISADTVRLLWLMTNVSNGIILLMLLIYFLPVNFSFVNGTISLEDVSSELVTWEIIHVIRTFLTIISVVFAVMALLKLENEQYKKAESGL